MNLIKALAVFSFFFMSTQVFSNPTTSIVIEWSGHQPSGSVEVTNGTLKNLHIVKGKGVVDQGNFTVTTSSSRLLITLDSINKEYGPHSTLVSLRLEGKSFSFFLRDVTLGSPIYVPEYHSVVLCETDARTYADVEHYILSKNLATKIQHIESNPEASFSAVAAETRAMSAPTWLGISRDFRLFEFSESLPDAQMGEANLISPKYAAFPVTMEEFGDKAINYMFSVGRGVGVYPNIHRHLEKGYLPILNSYLHDDDIQYHGKAFVALEKSPLSSLKGTDFLVAAKYSGGPNTFTAEQEQQIEERKAVFLNAEGETVFFYRVEAHNTGAVPRYAWFRSPNPGNSWFERYPYTFNPQNGFSTFSSDKVFCISKLNGKPLLNDEVSILLQPGEKVVVEFYVPHQPISEERATALKSLSIDDKLAEVESFWESKLQQAATVSVPEKRINEMIRAGLLHLDLITFGEEPAGVLAPNVGVYSPISTESAPIIQYYISMGLNDIAKRSLEYFFEKQHEDGLMQNFGGYMVETGAVLWALGEYFRYTKDIDFIESLEEKILKSCNYLIAWCDRNKKEELRGRGYGMIDGKVADPEDHFHQFMLNGYGYLGLSRMAEVFESVGSKHTGEIREAAEEWKVNIRESVENALALAPLVPLGDGRWVPSLPPWAEADGPRALYQKNERFWSHGTFTVADAMLGPMYLVFCEVLDEHDPISKIILEYNSELFYQGNTAFSQPYYSRHNWMQAKLGMVKPFLNTYYTTMSGHADRETYTFWEHTFKVSPHKTHEEAWFLMETRWMLYMEDNDTLKLLNTIPRTWMENGKSITLNNVNSYFGSFNVKADSKLDAQGHGEISAKIEMDKASDLQTVVIRLPHPSRRPPTHVEGGRYDVDSESIIIDDFQGDTSVTLVF